jgi:hypothetical protein
MHYLMNSKIATSYQPVQTLESIRLLHDLIQSPQNYEQWLERYSSAVISSLGFGKVVEIGEKRYVRLALKGVHEVERVASPGAYLVDLFPILMAVLKFMAPFKRELAALSAEGTAFFRQLQDDIRHAMKGGNAPVCWERTFLEKQDDYGLSDDEAHMPLGPSSALVVAPQQLH